jgi:hypothetical protein
MQMVRIPLTIRVIYYLNLPCNLDCIIEHPSWTNEEWAEGGESLWSCQDRTGEVASRERQ